MGNQNLQITEQEPLDSEHSAQITEKKRPSEERQAGVSPQFFGAAGSSAPHDIPLTSPNLLFLQRSVGNREVHRLLQAKLQIGHPGDPYEREADRVAEQILHASNISGSSSTPDRIQLQVADEDEQRKRPEDRNLLRRQTGYTDASLQRQVSAADECRRRPEEEAQIQGESRGSSTPTPGRSFEQDLTGLQHGGEPLSDSQRSFFEPRFGADFSQVRIHRGAQAGSMARQANARAFTTGRDIVFGDGEYAPDAPGGQQLLAHELTHVVQQNAGDIQPKAAKVRPDMTSAVNRVSPKSQAVPTVQRFSLSDIGSAISEGASFVADVAESAVEWTAETATRVVEYTADALMSVVERVAPGLVRIIRNGPVDLLGEALSNGIQRWIQGLLGPIDFARMVVVLKNNFVEVFNVIRGVLNGDPKSCKAFSDAIDGIRTFIQSLMDNPAIQALRDAFATVTNFVKKITDLVLAPVFDTIMDIAGGVFNAAKSVASTIWGWIQAAGNVLSAAFDWVKEKLGITGDGEGGVWEWLKGFASDVWSNIKSTLDPVIGPLKTVLTILVAFSPVGPMFIAIRYGPQIVEAVQWLWNNKDNPNIVRDAHEQMGHTILPQLLTSLQSFSEGLDTAVSGLLGDLLRMGEGVLSLLGGLTGVPLLRVAREFVQSLSGHIQALVTWVREQFQAAVNHIKALFHKIRQFVAPLIEVLSSLALAVVNPAMIPIILAGWAWRLLPDCYKPPIINFLLDALIGILEAIPALPTFGALWPLLKPGILGFLTELRGRSDEEKIAVSDKVAKIISGASPAFIFGFVKGLLVGIWEGLTDPFVLMYQALRGLNNLMDWFLGLFIAPAAAESQPTGAAATSGGNGQGQADQTVLQGRMRAMGRELEPDVDEVTGNFIPAVEESFQGGDGITYEQLSEKLGDLWDTVQQKVREAGQWLAGKIIEFLMRGSAERELGEKVGWLAGTITFEVILGILTAGAWQPLSAAGKALKFFARILDWTGEVLGAAFRMLAKIGGYLMDAFRALGKMLSKAGGAVGTVLDALKRVGRKLIEFGRELLGRLGRGVAGEAAEEAGERTAKEAIEETGERAGREITEEVGEQTGKEAVEETGERGVRDEALKAAQFAEAMAAARTIAETNDAIDTPVPVVLVQLNALKRRYRWIDAFEARPKPVPGHFSLHMIASDNEVDRDYSVEGRLPEGTQREIGAREAAVEGAHDIGVRHGREAAESMGLRDANWVNPFEYRGKYGQGFDDVMEDSAGNLWIVEYKGGTAELAPGQMSRSWIVSRIDRYRTQGGPLGEFWADRLEEALNNNQLRGVALSTPIHGTVPQPTAVIGTWQY